MTGVTAAVAADRFRLLAALLLVNLAALAVSGWRPYDRGTWLLEVLPTLVALPLLVATYRSYPLSTLLYCLITLHACVLALGGAFTYARVPLGFWVQDLLGLGRNPYDKLGHLVQGFVPAIIAREILLRGDHVRGRRMLAFICVCIPLAVSALYELIEWWTALALGQGADEFLGTQGDPWDTQSDMFCALLGAIAAVLLLAPAHDRSLARLIAFVPKHSPSPASTE
jgi:putative membrane protein